MRQLDWKSPATWKGIGFSLITLLTTLGMLHGPAAQAAGSAWAVIVGAAFALLVNGWVILGIVRHHGSLPNDPGPAPEAGNDKPDDDKPNSEARGVATILYHGPRAG